MREFAYHRPQSLAEACALAQREPGPARFLAGGTDLFLALEHGPDPAACVIDLKAVPGLDGIAELPGGSLEIGALACMAEIMAHPAVRARYPALAAGAEMVGGPPIRNRATLGGNLCNASPAADTSTPLLAYGATLAVAGPEGERELPLADLWRGPRATALAPAEVLRAVRLAAPVPRTGSAFTRLTRSAMDIALVNAAAVLTLADDGTVAAAAIALGAVAPTVVRAPAAEALLQGRPVVETTLVEASARAVEEAASPIDDVRASAEYRRDAASALVRRALVQAAERARGGGA